jgi:hypothetical protein
MASSFIGVWVMSDFQATAVIVALFALRCIAPLVLTLVIVYIMNRLVDRWQAADDLRVMEQEDLTVRPAGGGRLGGSLPVITIPCWILRNCEPEARTDCPAFQHPGLPCWMVRSSKGGPLPAACPDCPLYKQALALA